MSKYGFMYLEQYRNPPHPDMPRAYRLTCIRQAIPDEVAATLDTWTFD